MAIGLTERQLEVLRFIASEIEERGYPPTIREIGEALEIASTNGVNDHLKALEKKGYLQRDAAKSRALIPTAQARQEFGLGHFHENVVSLAARREARSGRLVEIPIVGRVAAGQPILAEQHIQGRYQIDPALFKPRADYLLKVRGMSMRDIGILDGDLLAVHRTPDVRSGQIVVARIGNDVTVKRFKRQGNQVQLLPENPDFEPIVIDLKHEFLAIEGIGVGIIRNGKGL